MKSYSAIFEGEQANKSISDAINNVFQDNESYKKETGYDLCDIVIILRGGGAKSSLAYLDEFEIVSNVSKSSYSGLESAIGHEEDSVLIDEYSNDFSTHHQRLQVKFGTLLRKKETFLMIELII